MFSTGTNAVVTRGFAMAGNSGAGKSKFLQALRRTLGDPAAGGAEGVTIFDAGTGRVAMGPHGFPERTRLDVAPQPAVVRLRRGGWVRVTFHDVRGELLHELPTLETNGDSPASAYARLLEASDALALFLPPEALQDFGQASELEYLVHRAGQAVAGAWRRRRPSRLNIVFSKADGYGVGDLGAPRLIGRDPKAIAACEAYRSAWGNQVASRWTMLVDAVANRQGLGPEARDLRRWLMERTRVLWDALLRGYQIDAGRFLEGYLVSAEHVVPARAPGLPTVGVTELAADFLGFLDWRDGGSPRPYEPLVEAGGVQS
jgi:hypothetical protein